ncbi:hypothetical protein NMT15_003505 [Vibrio cholerae]|nr:hypothetical protein [Vibrio cholerae]EHY0954956.1 hypothetical protein [Vibrio cholerae]EJL6909237.1 hypothetical protein [Vibrio cholerae]EKF9161599.1 hypothetical protein [Vibrio cholerae]EKF9373327.1 hypothetical protein [Vibrio cholerae]
MASDVCLLDAFA